MNHRHTCTDCHQPIPNGRAVLRSENLELVARCTDCHATRSVLVPQPRFARPVSEVLAEARSAR